MYIDCSKLTTVMNLEGPFGDEHQIGKGGETPATPRHGIDASGEAPRRIARVATPPPKTSGQDAAICNNAKKSATLCRLALQMDLEHQRAMRSTGRAVERRRSEGPGNGQRITQAAAARMVTAFMENSFPNFLEGETKFSQSCPSDTALTEHDS